MISLVYYLGVVAAVWMRPAPGSERGPVPRPVPAIAGGSQEADGAGDDEQAGWTGYGPRVSPTGARCAVIIGLTLAATAATVFFGVIPSPLVEWSENAGEAIGSLLG